MSVRQEAERPAPVASPARAPAPAPQHPHLITDITVEHGPVGFLGRFFLRADTMARQRGVTMSFATYEELLEVNRKNRASWPSITTMYDYRYCPRGVTADRAFCIVGRSASGEVVTTNAGRVFQLDGDTLYDQATSMRMFYDEPERMKMPGERCEVTATIAKSMPGRLLINGGVWIHPDYRKRQLSNIIPRVARAYALTRWNIDNSMGFMMEGPTRGGVIDSVGYPHREWELRLINAPNGNPRCCLAWMDAGELVEDLDGFLAGFDAQIDERVQLRRAQ